MDDRQLQQAILDDLEFLKTFKIDILDKGTYYRKIRKYALSILLCLYLPVLVLGLFFTNFNFLSSQGNDFFSYPYDRGCVIGGLIIPFLMTINLISKLNKWVVFEEKILPHLKTKSFILESIKKLLKLYMQIYVASVLIGLFLIGPFAGILVTLLAAGASGDFFKFLINLESSRIGTSILFEYLKKFFDDKKDVKGSLI
jgi:hypothetical protein